MKYFKRNLVVMSILLLSILSISYASNDPPICGTTGTTAINLSQTAAANNHFLSTILW